MTLVTRLNFLKPNGRFHIESKYGYLKEIMPSEYHRVCAMECLITWLRNQKMNDQGKKQKLLTELFKIDDFKDFTRELAMQESVELPEDGADVHKKLAAAKLKLPAIAVEAPYSEVHSQHESTTRSATFGQPQAQDSWAPIQDEGTSPMPFSSISFGDVTQGREVISEATPFHGGTSYYIPEDVSRTSDASGVKFRGHHSQSLRLGEATSSWPEEDSSISSSGTQMGSGNLSTGAQGDISEEESGDSLNKDDEDTLTSMSVITVYSVAIDLKITQHLYTILDICQRIKDWQKFGRMLGVEEAFIAYLEQEEEIEERLYSLTKKWLAQEKGKATFQDLMKVLEEVEEEHAKLALQERLDEELDEDNQLLLGSIERDILTAS